MYKGFIEKISAHIYYLQPNRSFYAREIEIDDELFAAIDEFNQNTADFQEWLGECYLSAEGRARSGGEQPAPPAFLLKSIKKDNNNGQNKPKRVRGKGKAVSSPEQG